MFSSTSALRSADHSILLIAPEQTDPYIVQRAGSVAKFLDAELHVFCPIVTPPAPHSWLSPGLSLEMDEIRRARDLGRRAVQAVQATCNQSLIGAQIETGLCDSVTDALLDRSARLEPDLIMIPNDEKQVLAAQPFLFKHELVWSRLKNPVWAVCPHETSGNSVIGVVSAGSSHDRAFDEEVANNVSYWASRLGTEAYLVACMSEPGALEIAADAVATPEVGRGQRRVDANLRRLYDLASRHDIPELNVRLHHGAERDVLEAMIRALDAGVVIASGRHRRRYCGLVKEFPASDLIGLPCDLLVLGDPGTASF